MELICILCPNGCTLDVERTPAGLVVKGNRCPKGEEYGREESTDPHRTLTAVVPTDSTQWPCAPVKTEKPVARNAIPGLLKQLYAMRVRLPVRRGERLIEHTDGTGVAVVFTRSLPPGQGE